MFEKHGKKSYKDHIYYINYFKEVKIDEKSGLECKRRNADTIGQFRVISQCVNRLISLHLLLQQ